MNLGCSSIYNSKGRISPSFQDSKVISSGLPDGIFSFQPPQVWYILEGLGMEIFDIFYDHFVYFEAVCFITYIYVHLEYFVVICYIFPFLVYCIKKNLATLLQSDQFDLCAAVAAGIGKIRFSVRL
jgi:hypothetical protein